MKIKLKSNFHNTETFVIAKEIGDGEYSINERQWRGAKNRTCGGFKCICQLTAPGFIEYPEEDGMTFQSKETLGN